MEVIGRESCMCKGIGELISKGYIVGRWVISFRVLGVKLRVIVEKI